MPGDPPILIHVGLHKTGTTWLQTTLYRPNAGEAIEYSEDWAALRGRFLVATDGEFDPAAARAAFDDLVARAGRRGVPVVLADEILAALPFHQRFVRRGVAERLAACFPEAKILVTVREQTAVIASSYGHYLRGGRTASLGEFLAYPEGEQARVRWPILDRSHFDYDGLLDLYERFFGAGNVLVAPMEWMLVDPEGLRGRLTSLTGAPWPAVADDSPKRVVNRASSVLAYEVMRQLNRLYTDDWKARRRSFLPTRAAYWVDKATPRGLDARMRQRQRRLIDASLGDTFAASNRRLAERIGIDLARFGYRVA